MKVGCVASVSEETAISLLGIKVKQDTYRCLHSDSLEHREMFGPGLGHWGLLNWEELEI